MMPKTLLITGGAGLLGQWLVRFASAKPDQWQVYYTWGRTPPPADLPGTALQCNLLSLQAVEQVFLQQVRPQVVIHCAAVTQRVSEIAPIANHVAQACQVLQAHLIHLSTDVIFDGRQPPYSEDAPANPVNPYGQAKYQAEQAVFATCPSAAVARTSLIFSHQPIDHQTGWLINGLKRGEVVNLFTDEYRCPIWVQNLALAVLELAVMGYVGPLNLCGAERLSRWAYGNQVLDLLEVFGVVQPAWRAHLRSASIAESGLLRPPDLTLDLRTTTALLRTPILPIGQVLRQLRTDSHWRMVAQA
jgi:dTDP-4-dehydrorhamnose reductase